MNEAATLALGGDDRKRSVLSASDPECAARRPSSLWTHPQAELEPAKQFLPTITLDELNRLGKSLAMGSRVLWAKALTVRRG